MPLSPVFRILSRIAFLLLLAVGPLLVGGCAQDETDSERQLTLVEHPNPMGGPSTYVYR